ncbi:MAG: beta/gamma crystallin-related protein [Casimicrobiaceae bacterium]
MSISLRIALGIAGLAVATTAAAQVTFYAQDGFHGQQFSTDHSIRNMDRVGFNDRASSVVVNGGNWQVCEDADFGGRCMVLQPGEYPSLAKVGLRSAISSLRPVGEQYADATREDANRTYVAEGDDYHRRPGERLFEARVTSVHAVVGPPERRCWVERREYESNANVPGAIAGAVIGGILGHQIGSGHGRDVATAGGAVAGAAIGANVGRDDGRVETRDVQRCKTATHYDRPDYWDVTYSFRGREHHAQMASPPGATITVNRDGEPRM